MKKALAIVAAVVVAVAAYAVTATAGQQGVTPKQVKALTKKVNALSKKVKTLTRDLNGTKTALNAVAGCVLVQAVPVAQFGAPDNGEGYQYHYADGTTGLETALDLSDPNSEAWALLTTKQCADGINSQKHAKTVLPLHAHR